MVSFALRPAVFEIYRKLLKIRKINFNFVVALTGLLALAFKASSRVVSILEESRASGSPVTPSGIPSWRLTLFSLVFADSTVALLPGVLGTFLVRIPGQDPRFQCIASYPGGCTHYTWGNGDVPRKRRKRVCFGNF